MKMNAEVTAGRDAGIRSALGSIDRAKLLLALLDDVTDSADEIRLSGDAVMGLKLALRQALDSLRDARETLERISYAPLRLDRTSAMQTAGAD